MTTTTVQSTTGETSEAKVWPCPDWCDEKGHAGGRWEHQDDRKHYSDRVVNIDELEVMAPTWDATVGWQVHSLAVYAEQGWREVSPRVRIALDDSDCIDLTVDEARQLYDGLTDLLVELTDLLDELPSLTPAQQVAADDEGSSGDLLAGGGGIVSAQPITRRCPVWCGDGEGHDWAHATHVSCIGLMTVSRVLAHQADRDPIGKLWPDEGIELTLEDGHGDTTQRLVCSPAEARSVAAALVRVADLIEFGG